MDKVKIDINFFPLQKQEFDFTIYVQKCVSDLQKCDDFNFETRRFNLALGNENNYEKYFVTLEPQNDFLQQSVNSTVNNWLTIWYLYKQLCFNINKHQINASIKNKYEKYIDVVIKNTSMGDEIIKIIPKHICGQFGLLIDYHFRKASNIAFSREIQKLSLSLDSSGSPNKNYYSDKYHKIMSFVNSETFLLLNPFGKGTKGESIPKMIQITSDRLKVKKYIFGNEKPEISQYKGIETFGPYQLYNGNPILCFVFRNDDKDLSHKLYYGLLGKTYPTFKGMEKIFKFPMNKENVIGIPINNYTESEIARLIIEMKDKAVDRPVIPIILVPWTKETANKEQSKQYFMMKHHFIKENISSQFVGIPRVNNYENLKWSISSIGLQIFTKLGGSPWCLEVEKKCLIIGIGQSHKKNNDNKIERYFSYSIMTDSSGIFKNIKVLSENTDENEYLNGLAIKLKEIIQEKVKEYDNIVIHTSFKLKDSETAKINELIKNLSDEIKKDFMVIRFSSNHDYMGFNLAANSKTPYESTIIKLNRNEYLVWFEGLSSTTQTIRTRIGPPIHLTIDFAKSYHLDDILYSLQDAINLSGANWRGFNAKTIPVSVLYARLLSSFLGAFEEFELERIDIEQLTPWFL